MHNRKDLTEGSRLAYLKQSMDDPELKRSISDHSDEDGAYDNIVRELQDRFDRPRIMHKMYCESMRTMTTNKNTRAGITQLADTVTAIFNGFVCLKGENC